MNNEELKKKIVDIALHAEWTDMFGDHNSIGKYAANAIADALIAAGIGDVKTVQKIATSATAMAVLEAAQAEHRALVAEKALQKFAETITCEDCPFFSDCASSEKMEDLIHSKYCFSKYLKQAEKELAEERKDD